MRTKSKVINLFGPMNLSSITISAIIATALSFLIGIQGFLILTFSLVVADWITGVLASRKRKIIAARKTGKKMRRLIESKRLRDSIDKFVVYFLFILISEGVWHTFVDDKTHYLTYLATAYVAYTEYKSIVENVEEVTGMVGGKAILSFVADRIFPNVSKDKERKS